MLFSKILNIDLKGFKRIFADMYAISIPRRYPTIKVKFIFSHPMLVYYKYI